MNDQKDKLFTALNDPYTEKSHPQLYAKFGEGFINKRVNPFIKKCAMQIAFMDGGDECQYVECSDLTSKKSVIAFADFKCGRRLWISEKNFDNPIDDRWRDKELLSHKQRSAINKFRRAH